MLPKKLFDYSSFGRIYYDTVLDEYTVNVDGFTINGAVVGTADLNTILIDDLEDSVLEAIYNINQGVSFGYSLNFSDSRNSMYLAF